MNSFYEQNFQRIYAVAVDMLPEVRELIRMFGRDETVRQMYDLVDSIQTKGEDHRSCSKGCSLCCHDIIYASKIEIEYIRTKLKERGIKPNKRLHKIQNNRPVDLLKWAEKRCGYLSDEGLCRIYDIRPMVCRTHNSTDDPIKCDASQGPSSHRQQYIIEVEAIALVLSFVDGKHYFDNDLTGLHTI